MRNIISLCWRCRTVNKLKYWKITPLDAASTSKNLVFAEIGQFSLLRLQFLMRFIQGKSIEVPFFRTPTRLRCQFTAILMFQLCCALSLFSRFRSHFLVFSSVFFRLFIVSRSLEYFRKIRPNNWLWLYTLSNLLYWCHSVYSYWVALILCFHREIFRAESLCAPDSYPIA